MKLAAIYNIFDGEELLEGSILQIRKHVDYIVCVVQSVSNYGEHYPGGLDKCNELLKRGLIEDIVNYTPPENKNIQKQREKRQLGLDWIKQKKIYSHFIMLDCDEYYETANFSLAKKFIIENNLDGSVIKLRTYFKEPTLKIEGFDNYYVPFIHQLKTDSFCGPKVKYPYYVDATRRINSSHVTLIPASIIYMHHYSWIRQDITRKINNHAAKVGIQKGNILKDYKNAKAGYYVSHYRKKLILANNIFNIIIHD